MCHLPRDRGQGNIFASHGQFDGIITGNCTKVESTQPDARGWPGRDGVSFLAAVLACVAEHENCNFSPYNFGARNGTPEIGNNVIRQLGKSQLIRCTIIVVVVLPLVSFFLPDFDFPFAIYIFYSPFFLLFSVTLWGRPQSFGHSG